MWTVCNMLLKAACSDWIVGAMTHLIDRTNHDRQVRDFDKKCQSLSPSIANYSLFASRMKELLSFCTMAQFTYNSLNSTGINPSNYDVTRTATDSKKKSNYHRNAQELSVSSIRVISPFLHRFLRFPGSYL